MKELDLDIKTRVELSVKQKKQIEYELIGHIIPHEGHVIWQINKETLQIERAKFSNATYVFGGENKKEIILFDDMQKRIDNVKKSICNGKDIRFDNPSIGRSTVWKPTCQLRWKIKDIDFDIINKQKVLQQMWQGDMGEQEWKDIELAQE